MERETGPHSMRPDEMAFGEMTAKCLGGGWQGIALKALQAPGGENRKVRDFTVFGCLSAYI